MTDHGALACYCNLKCRVPRLANRPNGKGLDANVANASHFLVLAAVDRFEICCVVGCCFYGIYIIGTIDFPPLAKRDLRNAMFLGDTTTDWEP